MSIARNLKREMDARAYTVARLAAESGVDAAFVRKYLSGKARPSESVLAALAGSLGCTAGELAEERITRRAGKLRPEDAARRLGRSAQDIRVGLQYGVLPFGKAYKREGNRVWSYEIDPAALEAYAEAQEAAWRRIAGE